MKRIASAFLLGMAPVVGHTADDMASRSEAIDNAFASCYEQAKGSSDPSTMALVCISKAYVSWSEEVDRNYAELLSATQGAKRRTIEESQRSWVMYRSNEFSAIDEISPTVEDGSPVLAAEFFRVQILKARSMQLGSYLDLVRPPTR